MTGGRELSVQGHSMVGICVVMSICFWGVYCEGITLWEFDCTLICSQPCCLLRLHSDSNIVRCLENTTTHFASFVTFTHNLSLSLNRHHTLPHCITQMTLLLWAPSWMWSWTTVGLHEACSEKCVKTKREESSLEGKSSLSFHSNIHPIMTTYQPNSFWSSPFILKCFQPTLYSAPCHHSVFHLHSLRCIKQGHWHHC